jgi:hypothetical protein
MQFKVRELLIAIDYILYIGVVLMLLLHVSRPTSRFRPAPLNTIELQKRASKFLHMNSETTMKVYIYWDWILRLVDM